MKIDDKNRPKEIICDEIWELYKLLEGLDEHYVFYDKCKAPEEREELFYLEKTTIGDDGVYYAADSIGMELPYRKDEWVELLLTHIEYGRMDRYKCRITVNAVYKNRKSVQQLLEEAHIRIPLDEELRAGEYEDYKPRDAASKLKIPVVNIPVPVETESDKWREEIESDAFWFLMYLRRNGISYQEHRDGDTVRYNFVFMSKNSPGFFVEGCVCFGDKAVDARVSYNQIASDVCKGSEHRSEILKLLNFINARVFTGIRDGKGYRSYDPKILYTPRIYLEEDEGYRISIATTINYKFWDAKASDTRDFITAYCAELLDRLSPFIFGVLQEGMSVSDAILGIEKLTKW